MHHLFGRFSPPRAVALAVCATVLACLTASTACAALPAADGPWTAFGTAGTGEQAPFATGTRTQVSNAGLQSTGAIVSVVVDEANPADLVLQRHGLDGMLDSSFGAAGVSRTPLAGALATSAPWALRVDGQDRIWVVATHDDASGTQVVTDVLRFDPDGSIDASFAASGAETFAEGCPAGEMYHTGFELRPGGGFLLGMRQISACAGGVATPATPMHRVHVHDDDGVEEPAFAGGIDISSTDPTLVEQRVVAMLELASGDILASRADFRSTYESDASIVRIAAAGTLDATFAGTGELRIADASVHGLWADDDGAFFAGVVRIGRGPSVTRHAADGAVDATWGDAGSAHNAFDNGRAWAVVSGLDTITRGRDGRFHACGLLLSTPDGFTSIAEYEDIAVRWSATGELEANDSSTIDLGVPGIARFASGCYGGSDGRVAHVGWDVETVAFAPTSFVRMSYARYDFDPPIITGLAQGEVGNETSYTVTATDAGSGLENVIGAYSFDGGATWQASRTSTLPTLRPDDPAHDLRVRDRAGNVATRLVAAPPAPPPPPVPGVSVDASSTNASVTFTARVQDPAGNRAPYAYSFDGGASWQGNATSIVEGLRPGTTTIAAVMVRAADGSRSTIVAASATTIDNGKPSVSVSGAGRGLRGVLRAGEIVATGTSSYGSVRLSATFRGRPVAVVDGRIAISKLPEGVGFLVVRATDVEGDTAQTSLRLTIDRTAPRVATTSRYVLGPNVMLRATDAIAGPTASRVRVRLRARTGSLRVSTRVRDRVGNAATRSVRVERRLALRDQSLNRDLKLVARDGSRFRAQKGMPQKAFRFLQQTAPWYSQIAQQDPYVTEAQWRLVKLGCLKPGSHQPGRLDLATIRGVQRYQRARGLEVLGTVGPRTRHALDLALLAGLPRVCR